MLRWRYRWVVVLAVVALVDLAARFAFDFEMTRVTAFEAVLFGATCIVLVVLATMLPLRAARSNAAEWVAAVAIGLAGVRAGMWAGGADVMTANLVTLAVAALLGLGYVVWRRGKQPPQA